jgi:hypothetical protein
MRKSLTIGIVFGLLVVATGCQRRAAKMAYPPPPPPAPVQEHIAIPHATLADMPVLPPPPPPSVVLGGEVAPVLPRPKPARPVVRHPVEDVHIGETKPVTSPKTGSEPPATTPIGELSAAPNTQGLPSSASIKHEIQSILAQLNRIHHALNANQKNTASQVRTFLAKAKNALTAGDLDGAHTLTVKARVLLSELQ